MQQAELKNINIQNALEYDMNLLYSAQGSKGIRQTIIN